MARIPRNGETSTVKIGLYVSNSEKKLSESQSPNGTPSVVFKDPFINCGHKTFCTTVMGEIGWHLLLCMGS